ncbi:MAG: hypothetical protein AYK23_03380 [Candidatus Proteinoplasmatales archaeon SG8-5]|nr:MAG: hypothetical protein AYK23_03380 [Candidatus Proteinoplasmatales archaeon SG8-5]
MRTLPILVLSSLLLSLLFCGLSGEVDAASKPLPKNQEETESPTLEIIVSLILIGIAAVIFEFARRRSSR